MLDLTNIRTISAGDESFVKGILEVFLNKEDEYVGSTTNALKELNYHDLRQAVHKIKSSISVLGMIDFKKKLNTLEVGIERELLTPDQISKGVEEALVDFQLALNEVKEALKKL